MLSRVAEALYWLGRYVERAENTARIVSVNSHLQLDLPPGLRPDWQPLIDIVGANEPFEENYDTYDERSVVRCLLGDRKNPGSMVSSLEAARSTARTIRDTIPRSLWEMVNELQQYSREELKAGLGGRGRDRYLREVMRRAQGISGVVHDVMRHDFGYHFLRIGRLLERADMTTRLVDAQTFALVPDDKDSDALQPAETLRWKSVLHSLSAEQTYRRHVQPRISRSRVLEFVLADEDFPRSYFYCVSRAQGIAAQLPRSEAVQRCTGHAQRALRSGDIHALSRDMPALHEFVDELQVGVGEIHDAIEHTYYREGMSPEEEEAEQG